MTVWIGSVEYLLLVYYGLVNMMVNSQSSPPSIKNKALNLNHLNQALSMERESCPLNLNPLNLNQARERVAITPIITRIITRIIMSIH